MAHPKLEQIRARYECRCGYCGVSEVDAGGDLTVDHFQPVSAGGSDDDDNLVYACGRSNQFKGATLPASAASTDNKRLLHPLRDNMETHVVLDPKTGYIIGISETGKYHSNALRLNRRALVAHRQRRQVAARMEAQLEQTLAEIRSIQEQLEQQDTYILMLERLLAVRDAP
jgi:hypothetical protein